jgi:plasmid stability protein
MSTSPGSAPSPSADRGADPLGVAPQWRYIRLVPSVQIKNVPEDVHRVMRRRAAAAGQSLQEYLLARLVADASEEPIEEVLARIGQRSGGRVGFDFTVDALRDERERR